MKQKKLRRFFCGIVPHLNIVLSAILLTLFVTDRFNRAMSFINNNQMRLLLLIYCLLLSVQVIIRFRKNKPSPRLLLPTLCLFFAFGFLYALAVDYADRSLGVLGMDWLKWGLCVFCVLTVTDAVKLIRLQRRDAAARENGVEEN